MLSRARESEFHERIKVAAVIITVGVKIGIHQIDGYHTYLPGRKVLFPEASGGSKRQSGLVNEGLSTRCSKTAVVQQTTPNSASHPEKVSPRGLLRVPGGNKDLCKHLALSGTQLKNYEDAI
jgi:hypothetical protein